MANRRARAAFLEALFLASSCSAAGATDPLALYPARPEGHAALLRGTLEMEGPCLYIVGEGGERWLAAFPWPGTTWNPEDRAVQVGDRVLRVGEAGAFGGGESKGEPGAISWVKAPAESCDAPKVWLVTGLAEP